MSVTSVTGSVRPCASAQNQAAYPVVETRSWRNRAVALHRRRDPPGRGVPRERQLGLGRDHRRRRSRSGDLEDAAVEHTRRRGDRRRRRGSDLDGSPDRAARPRGRIVGAPARKRARDLALRPSVGADHCDVVALGVEPCREPSVLVGEPPAVGRPDRRVRALARSTSRDPRGRAAGGGRGEHLVRRIVLPAERPGVRDCPPRPATGRTPRRRSCPGSDGRPRTGGEGRATRCPRSCRSGCRSRSCPPRSRCSRRRKRSRARPRTSSARPRTLPLPRGRAASASRCARRRRRGRCTSRRRSSIRRETTRGGPRVCSRPAASHPSSGVARPCRSPRRRRRPRRERRPASVRPATTSRRIPTRRAARSCRPRRRRTPAAVDECEPLPVRRPGRRVSAGARELPGRAAVRVGEVDVGRPGAIAHERDHTRRRGSRRRGAGRPGWDVRDEHAGHEDQRQQRQSAHRTRSLAAPFAMRIGACADRPARNYLLTETSSRRSSPPFTVCSSTVPIPRT